MKYLCLVLAAFLFLGCSNSEGSNIVKLEPWQNIEIIHENKVEPHASFKPYGPSELATTGGEALSSYSKSLNGKWEFHWVDSPTGRPDDFFKTDFDANKWSLIDVPSVWEREGYGYPVYANVEYPFVAEPFEVPSDNQNHIGSYRKEVTIPENWKDRHVFIEFGAVSSAMTLWVNGERVGYAQGSRTPLEFDITDYVKAGSNLVAVQVMRWNDGSWLENQDSWSLSGIYRGVTLTARPKTYIRDYFAATTLQNNYKDGVLNLSVEVRGASAQLESGWTVDYELSDGLAVISNGKLPVQIGEGGGIANAELVLESVRVWSAEKPNLYTFKISLIDPQGTAVEWTQSRVGFRSVELENGRVLINGYPIKFRGVNIHEIHPETGYVVDEQTMRRDFELLKAGNFNAVRTSHYPQDPKFYHLADEYGLYVVDEANLETHLYRFEADLAPALRPEWAEQMLDRTVRMIERDKNHASIVMWSPGNETGPGPNMVAIYDWAKKRDSSRLFQYADDDRFEGGDFSQLKVRLHGVSSDIQTAFYASPWSLERYAQEENDKPWIMMEYWHSMGNSLGNGQAYWETINRHSILQGGFIWDWVDQGLKEVDKDGRVWYGQGGDYGPSDVPSSDNFLHNGVIFPDRTVKPAYWDVKKAYQPAGFSAVDLSTGLIKVINRHHFTDLNEFELIWNVEADGITLKRGVAKGLSAAPGNEVSVELGDLKPDEIIPGAEYFLNIGLVRAASDKSLSLLPVDHIYATEQFKLPFERFNPVSPVQGDLQISEDSKYLSISGPAFMIGFDKSSGFLSTYRVNGENILLSELVPNTWRALTDNDYGFQPKTWDFSWRETRDNRDLVSFSFETLSNGGVKVLTSHDLTDADGSKMAQWHAVYHVRHDGAVLIDSEFDKAENVRMPPRVGVRVVLNELYEDLSWFGRGPHENYSDRKWSANISRYKSSVPEQYTPYLRPQENGYKTDTRWFSLKDSKGAGMFFTSLNSSSDGFGFSALPNPMEDFEASDEVWLNASDVNRMKPIMHLNALSSERVGTFVHIDAIQAGVGGDNSWSKRTHNEFTPREDKYRFIFLMKYFDSNQESEAALTRAERSRRVSE